MKEKKSSGSRKRTLASILGFVMVVGITIVGTLAFMNAVSNEKKNTFTGTNDIKLYLEEPNYNVDETGTIKWDDQLDPREYIPGESYDKDPTLYNTTGLQVLKTDGTTEELAEEWVAMRVDYSIGNPGTEVSREMLTTNDTAVGYDGKAGLIEDIEFDENWMKITAAMCSAEVADKLPENAEIYIYKYKLKAKDGITEDALKAKSKDELKTYQEDTAASEKDALTEKTSPLFSKIQLKLQAQLESNGYDVSDLTTFHINLKGGAIKDMVTITTDEIVDVTASVTDGDTVASGETYTPNQKIAGSKKVIDALVELLGKQS